MVTITFAHRCECGTCDQAWPVTTTYPSCVTVEERDHYVTLRDAAGVIYLSRHRRDVISWHVTAARDVEGTDRLHAGYQQGHDYGRHP